MAAAAECGEIPTAWSIATGGRRRRRTLSYFGINATVELLL
jgi:hypothetical protein